MTPADIRKLADSVDGDHDDCYVSIALRALADVVEAAKSVPEAAQSGHDLCKALDRVETLKP